MRWREWDVKLVKSANDRNFENVKSEATFVHVYVWRVPCVWMYVFLAVWMDRRCTTCSQTPTRSKCSLPPLLKDLGCLRFRYTDICVHHAYGRVYLDKKNYHLCVSVCVRRRKIKQSANFELLLERMRARTCTLTCILIVCDLWPVRNSLQVKARLTFEMNRLIQASWSHLAFITRKQCNIAWISSLVNTRRHIGLPTLFGPLSSSIFRCNLKMIYRVILYTCIYVTGLMHTWHVHHHKNVKSFVFYKIKASFLLTKARRARCPLCCLGEGGGFVEWLILGVCMKS